MLELLRWRRSRVGPCGGWESASSKCQAPSEVKPSANFVPKLWKHATTIIATSAVSVMNPRTAFGLSVHRNSRVDIVMKTAAVHTSTLAAAMITTNVAEARSSAEIESKGMRGTENSVLAYTKQ